MTVYIVIRPWGRNAQQMVSSVYATREDAEEFVEGVAEKMGDAPRLEIVACGVVDYRHAST